MPTKPVNYPHKVYMKTHSLMANDLPNQLKDAANIWDSKWIDTAHEGRSLDPALLRASKELHTAIKRWHNTDAEFEALADEQVKPKKKVKPTPDEVLEFFYFKKNEIVTKEALVKKGYPKDVFGLIPLNTRNFKLTPIKGEKGHYTLTKKTK